MSHYSPEFLNDRKAALVQLREDALKELEGIAKFDDDSGSYAALQPDYDVGDVEDIADSGTEAEVFQDRVAMVRELETTLNEADAALAKIEQGTYGKSEDTGEWLDEERLIAYPAARTAV